MPENFHVTKNLKIYEKSQGVESVFDFLFILLKISIKKNADWKSISISYVFSLLIKVQYLLVVGLLPACSLLKRGRMAKQLYLYGLRNLAKGQSGEGNGAGTFFRHGGEGAKYKRV